MYGRLISIALSLVLFQIDSLAESKHDDGSVRSQTGKANRAAADARSSYKAQDGSTWGHPIQQNGKDWEASQEQAYQCCSGKASGRSGEGRDKLIPRDTLPKQCPYGVRGSTLPSKEQFEELAKQWGKDSWSGTGKNAKENYEPVFRDLSLWTETQNVDGVKGNKGELLDGWVFNADVGAFRSESAATKYAARCVWR